MAKRRATAPNVKVSGRYYDGRAEMLEGLESKDTGFKYTYMNPDVTQVQLEREGYELVKDEKGEPLRWREDVIARRPLNDYKAEREAQEELSASTVESLYCQKPESDAEKHGDEYWKKNSAGRRVPKAKDPKEIDNYGGK